MSEERIKILKNENIIWLIYILIALLGIKANNLEIDDLKNNSNNNKKEYKSINIFLLAIILIIYGYFIKLNYNQYKNTNNRNFLLSLIGSIIMFIGGIIFIYIEINSDVIVPNEI